MVFYHSVWGVLTIVFFLPFCYRLEKQRRRKQMQDRWTKEFKSAMQSVSGSLTAGYSLEKAFRMAQSDMEKLYGKEAPICIEFMKINQQIWMNEALEKQLMKFALQTGVEDICNFAEMFQYAKRNGGNMTEIIKTTVGRMQDKEDILEDIKTAVTAKRMEATMLTGLVPAILLFISFSSGSYISVLYHSVWGNCLMSMALIIYLISALWTRKIVDIQV